MFDAPLSGPARVAVTVSVLVYVLQLLRALRAAAPPLAAGSSPAPLDASARRFAGWLLVASAVATAASHLEPLRPVVLRVFPIGMGAGLLSAVLAIASPSMRARVARFDDATWRQLLAWRAVFGALLLGLAALGHLPVGFAVSAGVGDLVVGWLAQVAPRGALDPEGPRSWRALVHGAALLDVVMVMAQAVLVVRPWAAAQAGNPTTMMALPWVFVPSMFALNLHGVFQVLGGTARRSATEEAGAQPGRDGSEPARRLRSAAS